jgi:hypothetical protein
MRFPPLIRTSILIPVWIACGVAGAVLLSVLDSSNQTLYSRLEKHGVVVAAIVTSTEPSNHNTVYYSFTARGKRYASGDRASPPNPDASKLAPGDHVHVVYDVRDPNYSCACDPRGSAKPSAWWRRLLGGLFLGSIVSVVITLNIQRMLHKRRGSSAASASA